MNHFFDNLIDGFLAFFCASTDFLLDFRVYAPDSDLLHDSPLNVF